MIVQAPDGKTIDFGELAPDQVTGAMQKMYPPQQSQNTESLDTPTQIGGLHQQMLTNSRNSMFPPDSDNPLAGIPAAMTGFGARAIRAVPFLSEAGSGIAATMGAGQGNNFPDRYNNLQQSQQAMRETYTNTQPTVDVGSVVRPELGGKESIVGPGGLGQSGLGLALSGIMPGPKNAPANFMEAVGQGAKTGAQYGATYGASDTNSFLPDNMALEQRAGNAVKGALLGAPLGAGSAGFGYAMEKPIGEKAPTSEEFKDSSRASFQQADSSGIGFNDKAIQQLPQDISQAFSKTGRMNADLHGDTLSAMKSLTDDINSGNMTLENLHQDRMLFQQVAQKNAINNPPDAMKANQAIDAIDGFIEKAKNDPSKMLTNGSPEQIASWQDAMDKWAQGSRVDEIQRIMDKANSKQQPAQAMQTGFNNLLNSKRFRYYSPDQKDLIRQAAQASPTVDVLKTLGSRLISTISLGSLHPITAAGEAAMSSGARDLGSMLQANRGQAIINNIAGGKSAPLFFPQSVGIPLSFGVRSQ